jgi:hypothetical protein
MDNQNVSIIKKIEEMSLKYHKLSLLFYELAQSLKQEIKKKNPREIKELLKQYDFRKLEKGMFNELKELRKDEPSRT